MVAFRHADDPRVASERDVLPPTEAGVCIRCRQPRRVRTILRVDTAAGLRASLVTLTSCACGTVETVDV